MKLSQPSTFSDPLTEVLRSGARSLLARAVEAEVAAFLDGHSEARTEEGRRRLVRHGHLPEREIMTGIGPVAVRAPRVRDRTGQGADRIRFSSALLPPYARRSKSLEVLIPVLYLKGISTGDFAEALAALLGPDAGGLSASTVARLTEVWADEHAHWLKRDLSATREGKLWNEFIARYHYLGYKTLVGAQMRYAVHDRNGWPLAMLGFSTAAWTLAPRDNFIGWTPQLREKNFPLVVDNPRFLILPWINIPNLGSHILAIVRRRLPQDWTERYNTTPVLIETFVQTPRYTGAVYKASGWIRVGITQGRGRYDRHSKRAQRKKDIWLRPLRKDWKRTLNR